MAGKNVYYISLVRNMLGYCYKVHSPNKELVREYAREYLGRMWCDVYEQPGEMKVIGLPIRLDEHEQPDYF